jgi:hypothetical protein
MSGRVDDATGWQTLVRLEVIYAPACKMPYLRNLVAYLAGEHKGQDGGPVFHFTADGRPINPEQFLDDLKADGWCF